MPKNKSALPFPRSIAPELVRIGDTIQVNLKPDRGLEVRHIGTVHHRSDHGSTRYLYTAEGATILSWDAKGDKRVHILLLHRVEEEQQPLFFFESELPERLAG